MEEEEDAVTNREHIDNNNNNNGQLLERCRDRLSSMGYTIIEQGQLGMRECSTYSYNFYLWDMSARNRNTR